MMQVLFLHRTNAFCGVKTDVDCFYQTAGTAIIATALRWVNPKIQPSHVVGGSAFLETSSQLVT